MSNYPSVAVVILNWNGRFFLEKFLPSIFNSTYPNVTFVLGDNHSTDDSIAFVKANYPSFRIIENSENLGFAGGYNAILSRVVADYYILLNSDVGVTPDWIQPVIQTMENDPSIAAAQPKILSHHRRECFEHAGAAGGYIDRYGFPFCRGRIFNELEKDKGQYDSPAEIFWATGAAFFVRRVAWEQANGLDADFFAHMEEIDLCWRLKRLGYKIAYCPAATVYHVGGATLPVSNPRKTYLNFRNNLYMLQKNLPFGSAIWTIFARLWFDLAALLLFMSQGKFSDAWAVSRAHQSFFFNIFKTAKKRTGYPTSFNPSGLYRGSIVWDFYAKGKKAFSAFDADRFL